MPDPLFAKDSVSVLNSGRSHGTVRYHAAMYHSQEVAVGWVPQHSLHLPSLSRVLHFTFGKAFYVPSYSLHERKCHYGLELPEVEVGHAFVVVLQDNVACISIQNKSAAMVSRVKHNVPPLL